MLANASHIVYILAHNIIWNPRNLLVSCMLLIRLYTLELVMLPLPLPFGGVDDLSMYML